MCLESRHVIGVGVLISNLAIGGYLSQQSGRDVTGSESAFESVGSVAFSQICIGRICRPVFYQIRI